MSLQYRTLILIALNLLVCPSMAKEGSTPDPLFKAEDILAVTITAPLTTLMKERSTEDELAGVLEYTGTDGTAVKLDIRIRARGHFRHANCDFPPLRLNFKKSQTDDTLFHKQDKVKLVVQCDKSVRYEQSLIREYLAYRVLNTLVDLSFRVRLLRVTYVDSEARRSEQLRFAFLVEHKDRLGKRHGMKEAKIEKAALNSIQPGALNLTSLFQFFISNTDFSPIRSASERDCCHNYVLFEKDDAPLIAIPYDFDLSGFVNAQYAKPDSRFDLRNVRERLYRGRCVNNGYVADSLRQFQMNRDAIYALINEQEGLSSKVRKSIIRSVNNFYKIIDDPRIVERQLIAKCI